MTIFNPMLCWIFFNIVKQFLCASNLKTNEEKSCFCNEPLFSILIAIYLVQCIIVSLYIMCFCKSHMICFKYHRHLNRSNYFLYRPQLQYKHLVFSPHVASEKLSFSTIENDVNNIDWCSKPDYFKSHPFFFKSA